LPFAATAFPFDHQESWWHCIILWAGSAHVFLLSFPEDNFHIKKDEQSVSASNEEGLVLGKGRHGKDV